MEDVLDLYDEPYDPRFPTVCFDERPCQLRDDVRAPVPVAPGRPKRIDYEYTRQGTCNLFGFFEPKRGWRSMKVTDRRTKPDVAECLRELVEEHYPHAERIRLVLDNLNVHRLSVLYERFPAERARSIARRLELHHTPPHGSWLNMIEVEFSVLARQCLSCRIADEDALRAHIAPWQAQRNKDQATVHWRFNTGDARTKLHRLYPQN